MWIVWYILIDVCLIFFTSLKTILLINIYFEKKNDKFASNLKIVRERERAQKLKSHIKFVHSTL